jgi:flagellar motor switch/type III secretory pathway protein FliN
VTALLSPQKKAQASEWLPDDALVAAPALAALDALIAAWSERWFARAVRRQEGGGAPPAVTVCPTPRHGWRRFAPGIWVDWGEKTPRALALHALGRAVAGLRLTADDERLIEMLGERLTRDLAANLVKSPAKALMDYNGEPGRTVCFTLCSAAQAPGLVVALDAALLVGLRKQQCPPWRPREALPQSLTAALGSVPVAFEAALGSVRIGLLEFEAIEPGDTIVLDQSVAAPIAIRSAANGASIRDTRLVREDSRLTLTAS